MAAANTDKCKKVAPKWVAQVGSGGITDASGTTIPLSSVTSLPTDTAVVVTIDRVDANGVKTPSLEETVVGVVSGSNLVSCIRGAEGTAQAHVAGAVVEVLVTATSWNDLIDAFLVAFNQDGTIKNGTIITSGVFNGNMTGTAIKVTATLSENSDTLLPSQKAVKTYVDVLPTASSTTTLTNKRITPRVVSTTSYTTDTGTSLNCDTTDIFICTAQAGDLKFNNPGGTPTDGQKLWIAVTGTGARALTYDTQFVASAGVALPTTTVTTARLDIGFVWNAATSTWRCVASS